MKLLLLLNFIAILNVTASVYSQNEKLNIQVTDMQLRDLFREIEKNSDYAFFFNDEYTELEKAVTLNLRNVKVDNVLNRVLTNSELDYKILENNFIIILPKSKTIQQVITGTVTDKEGNPLPGVSIVIEGTTTGTITNFSGAYSLEVPDSNAILIFSFIGYLTQEIVVGNQDQINISLEIDEMGLEEVVVVGYGTQKRETLTGSISTIQSKDIVGVPVTNVSNSLGGKLPGLVAVTASGEPGYDGTTLRIRGSNTFNDNSVLIVVDGVPDRSLERIDPHSIESITVLKDASAAIYGSRAANGVILVTTKRGKLGKPELTFTTEYGFSQPTRLPKMADASTYATLLNEVAYYDGDDPDYTAEQIQTFRDGSDPYNYPNSDWFSDVIKPWSAQSNQNVTISGGTEKMRYFVSLGAKQQDGNYKNSATYYNQYDFRSNIDGEITKDISVGVDIAGRLEDRNFPIRSAGDIFRGLIQSYPTSVSIWPNGEPGPAVESGRNPVATSTDVSGYNKDKYYVLNTNLKLDINIPWVKGLSFSGNFSYDQGFDFKKTFSKPFELYSLDHVDTNGEPVLISNTYGGGTDNTPSLKEEFTSNYTSLLFGVINYETKIGENHNLKLMVGSQVSKGNKQSFDAYRDYFLSTAVQELFAGQTNNQITGGSGSEYTRLSYFGRANYNYANKYLFEFVGRYDGSYIFPENNRFGFFPGVSVGWVVSEENFWKDNLSFVDFFKLRGSWGQTGNDRVDAFQYLTSYLFGYQLNPDDYTYPFVVNSGSGLTELQTLYEDIKANEDITWEVANQFDIGFNVGFFNSKLSIEAAYFDYRRSNILWEPTARVPKSEGIELPDVNYGKVSNKGFDFEIAYRDVTSGNFGYSVSVNAGYAKNKVIEWGEPEGRPEWQQTTGHPMGSGLYYQTDGIYHTEADIVAHDVAYDIGSTPEPGDVKFVDYNNDRVIDADDRVRTYKNNIPTLTFGSNINMNYKGFDLSILIQGATGAVSYIYSEAGRFGNYFQSFVDERWTPDNTSANGPRTFNRGNWYWANQDNTYWLRKTDYVRLKTVQLGYTIPLKSVQKAGIKNIRVYLSGYNLLTYSPDMKDFDPELGTSSTDRDAAPSITGYNYPLQRVVSMGFTVGF